MEHFGLLLKSYGAHAREAKRLIDSYRTYAAPHIPMTAVVPADDLSTFRSFTGSDVQLVPEEEFEQHLVTEPIGALRPGYVNQEIIKLAFHELGIYRHYFTVDSEAQFLRPLSTSDFLAPDGYPYSILVEDRDLAVDPEYFSSYWTERQAAHRRIWETVGVPDPVIRTCHGHTTFASPVLESFVTDFLQSQQWGYRDAIALAPYEYTWYNAWLLKSSTIPVHPRDPVIKVFHSESELLTSVARGVTTEDVARGYLGMVINGNFDQGRSLTWAQMHKTRSLAPYLSYAELGSVLRWKLQDSSARRFRGKK